MTKNVLSTNGEKQNLGSIFAELSIEKKEKYLKDQYGTVKGTTGFFDYRFRKHVHSVKDFKLSDGVQVTVCVVCNGGYYEGGGGDSSNYVMVIIGDKKYTTKSFKYDDSSYGTNVFTGKTSKTQKGQTEKEYKDILSVNYDSASDVCTIVVDTPIGEQTIETSSSKGMSFDEALLGKLYVPAGVQMDNISAEVAAEILSSLDLPENYNADDMYMQVLDMYKEQGDVSMLRDLLFGERNVYYNAECFKIPTQEPSTIRDPYIQQVFDRYIDRSYDNKQFHDFSDYKKLISMVHNSDIKKSYIYKLFDLVKAYPDMRTIKCFVDDFLSELEGDEQEHYQQLFDASYMVMNISSEKEETIAFIDLLAANKIENYQRLYDAYVKRGGALLQIDHYWSDYGYMNDRKREIQFFVDRGIDLSQDAFQEIDSLDAQQKVSHLKKILNRLKLWKEEYPEFVTDEKVQGVVGKNTANNVLDQYEYDTSSRSDEKMKFATLREMLYEEYGVPYTDTFYELFYNSFKVEYIQTHLLEHDGSDKITGQKILQIISQNEKMYARTKCMWFDWFLDHGYDVDEGLFQSAFLKMFENYSNDDLDTRRLYQEKYAFLRTDTIKEAYTRIADEGIADMYGYKHHQHIPYASLGAIKSLLQNFVTQETGKIGTASHVKDILQMFFERDDLTSEYASELATTLYTNGLHKQLKQFIESIGLKLDKSLILGWIQELLKKEELGTAEFLVNAAGLEERMMKHIIIIKLHKGCDISRDNEHFIERDNELNKLYTASQLSSLVTAGHLTKALELAYQNDVVLTPGHFQKYRQGQVDRIQAEKQKQIEAEKQKKLEIEDRIQQSRELQLMLDDGKYLVDIDRKRDQKFVFGCTEIEGPFVLSKPLERHKDIVKEADRTDDQILGGGWIKINDAEKTVILYASSGSYGAVYPEYHQLVISVIAKQYDGYIIQRK